MADNAREGDIIQVGNRKYALHSFLGKGGFSEVFLGVDETTRKRVALKIMAPRSKPDEAKSQLSQSTSEIKTMKQLNHPNVVRLLGYDLKCKVKGKQSIVMVQQLCPKGELFDYLMYTKNFDERLAMALFSQLCGGLQHLHHHGIAHRDLKPENLLFDGNYTLKIADFGFSFQFQKKSESGRRRMRTELGTHGYMAPEILSSNTQYTKKADVFAAGVILFIMIAGFPPFQNAVKSDWWFDKLMKKKHALFWKAHERTAKFPNEDLKSLLVKMMAPKEKDRYDIDEVLADTYVKSMSHKLPSKEELQQELMKRKSRVDKEKEKAKKQSSRATLLEILKQLEAEGRLAEVNPKKDRPLLLTDILLTDFYIAIKSAQSKSELTRILVNHLEIVTRGDDRLAGMAQDVHSIMSRLSEGDAMKIRGIFLRREIEGLHEYFHNEKIVEKLAEALFLTKLGKIDDWEYVRKFCTYEENLVLPQYPTGYCNAWRTKMGFGVLTYSVHTFAKGKARVLVNKNDHSIQLEMTIKKPVQLPVEDPNDEDEILGWKTGHMNVHVNLLLKLFKGDGLGENRLGENVLIIQNQNHFAMIEARKVIEEITTNDIYHLVHFLDPFDQEKGEHLDKSAYWNDKDIDLLVENNGVNSWILGN